MKVMMNSQEVYFAELEYNRFKMLINTQTYLSKEEYEFCFSYDKDIRMEVSYLGLPDGKDYINFLPLEYSL